MRSTLQMARRWYARYLGVLSLLQHPFLLACRLYWGGLFVFTGIGKLTHLALTAERFANWHVPAPYPNAIAAGATELVCGSLLVLGVASRLVTVPLIVTMVVAYLTAHADEVTDLDTFVTAPPFLFMFTCVLVLLFGAGAFSIDYLVRRFIWGSQTESRASPDGRSALPDSVRSPSPQDLRKGIQT
jgi:putative oxidoreductase